MTPDIDATHAHRRARYRSWVRRAAWLATAMGLFNVALMWTLWHPFFAPYIPPTAPLVGTFIGISLYFVGLSVPIIQRSAVNDLILPPLDAPAVEPWADGLNRRHSRVNRIALGIPAGAAFLTVFALIQLNRQSGFLTLWSYLPAFWIAAVLLIAQSVSRLLLRRWIATADDVRTRWALRWLPGADAIDLRAMAYQVLGAPGAATDTVQWLSVPGRRRAVAGHAAYLAQVARTSAESAADGFGELHRAAPDHPHGALGLAETRLLAGRPAPQASRHAATCSGGSMLWGHLYPYAQANQARSYALAGNTPAAVALVDTVEAGLAREPNRRRAAVLHRLALALAETDANRADALRAQAAGLDPNGDVGQRAASDALPAVVWP